MPADSTPGSAATCSTMRPQKAGGTLVDRQGDFLLTIERNRT
jgi:hypothetical protein